MIDDFRSDVTKTLTDGSRGRLRIDYGDPRQPEKPIAWMWRFIDASRTASELYGRALVVICAEQYASRLVVPTSQRSHPARWSSHGDRAAKALKKLAGPRLPSSLRQLETAVNRAHHEYAEAEKRAHEQTERERNKPVRAGSKQAAEPVDDLVQDADADGGEAELESGDEDLAVQPAA